MNILYIANVRIPTEKAHGLQIMKTCEAMADLGHQVELLVPRRKNPLTEDPFEYYGVKNIFTITHVFSLDREWGDKFAFFLQYVTFSFAVLFSKAVRTSDIVYGRDELALVCASFVSKAPIIWESHIGSWNLAARILVRRLHKIVVISKGLKDFYLSKRTSEYILVVAPDAVDLEDFAHPSNKDDSRKRLGLPNDKKIALYIGRLDGWKGVDVFCEAGKIGEKDFLTVLIGGEPQQIKDMRQKYPHAIFLGYHSYKELPDNQSAADVLVLPNSKRTEISSRYTSPLKLFTYMASERPIVASDLPSLREILDESCAYLVSPDDPAALARGIQTALFDSGSHQRARTALAKVQDFTWRKRAKRILDSLSTV